jgi:hypothetical protein
MHLTEEPPLPKGYRRTTITKAQRAKLLEELRRRYRERKAQQAAEQRNSDQSNS